MVALAAFRRRGACFDSLCHCSSSFVDWSCRFGHSDFGRDRAVSCGRRIWLVAGCNILCGGDGGGTGNALDDIMNTPLVRCDEPAWTLFGISLAGYNFLISTVAGLSILALLGKDRRV